MIYPEQEDMRDQPQPINNTQFGKIMISCFIIGAFVITLICKWNDFIHVLKGMK